MQYPKGYMDMDFYRKCVDEMVREGGQSIKFQWRGEPTLDPNLVERVQYAKRRGITEVMFNSNGFKLNATLIAELITAGLDKIIISVDGVSAEIYEKVRINGSYDRLIRNLNLLKDLSKGTQLKVRIQGVVMKENEEDMKGFKEYWAPLANELFLRKMYNPLKALNQGETKVGRRCPQTWQRLTVGWDGMVTSCCAPWEFGIVVGNANVRSLKEIWQGKAEEADIPSGLRKNYININQLRNAHRTDIAHTVEECAKCGLYDVRPEVRKQWDDFSKYRIK